MTNWTKALQAVIAGEPDVIPKGWYSVGEIAKEFGKCRAHTKRALKKLVAAKKADVKKFRARKKCGRVLATDYFRLR